MSKLTDESKGRPCLVRIPGYCEPNPETTVPAHLRMAGLTGGGQKAPDLFHAHACAVCHDVVDGRRKTDYSRDEIRRWHLEGIIRTQAVLAREGKIRW